MCFIIIIFFLGGGGGYVKILGLLAMLYHLMNLMTSYADLNL